MLCLKIVLGEQMTEKGLSTTLCALSFTQSLWRNMSNNYVTEMGKEMVEWKRVNPNISEIYEICIIYLFIFSSIQLTS